MHTKRNTWLRDGLSLSRTSITVLCAAVLAGWIVVFAYFGAAGAFADEADGVVAEEDIEYITVEDAESSEQQVSSSEPAPSSEQPTDQVPVEEPVVVEENPAPSEEIVEEDPLAAEKAELAALLAEEEAMLAAQAAEQQAAATEGTTDSSTTSSTSEDKAAEEQRKLDEAVAKYESALAKRDAAIARFAELPAFQEKLASLRGQLADAQAALRAAIDLRIPLDAQRHKIRRDNADILSGKVTPDMLDTSGLHNLLSAAQVSYSAEADGPSSASADPGSEQLAYAAAPEDTTASLDSEAESIDGEAGSSTSAVDVPAVVDLIAQGHTQALQVVDAAQASLQSDISSVRGQIALIEKELDDAEEQRIQATESLQDIIAQGNEAAFQIEKISSLVRQETVDAAAEVEKLDSKIEGVDGLKSEAANWDARYDEARVQALADAGAWYDAVDELGGLEESIVYGSGLDFHESRDVFIAKWGPAIDAFFKKHGAPLETYGSKIAESAYKHKVDPRLCAAVSMVESSGGKQCIKPHNAWGWGAADSDPEGLAKSWDSWEEAFEGWHKGMTNSETGLATATSLTAMGDIYCSTPNWGSRVATFMEEISSYTTDSTPTETTTPA